MAKLFSKKKPAPKKPLKKPVVSKTKKPIEKPTVKSKTQQPKKQLIITKTTVKKKKTGRDKESNC
jgi:hypothetical protein